jgi:hypothetical protein
MMIERVPSELFLKKLVNPEIFRGGVRTTNRENSIILAGLDTGEFRFAFIFQFSPLFVAH